MTWTTPPQSTPKSLQEKLHLEQTTEKVRVLCLVPPVSLSLGLVLPLGSSPHHACPLVPSGATWKARSLSTVWHLSKSGASDQETKEGLGWGGMQDPGGGVVDQAV